MEKRFKRRVNLNILWLLAFGVFFDPASAETCSDLLQKFDVRYDTLDSTRYVHLSWDGGPSSDCVKLNYAWRCAGREFDRPPFDKVKDRNGEWWSLNTENLSDTTQCERISGSIFVDTTKKTYSGIVQGAGVTVRFGIIDKTTYNVKSPSF